MILIPISWHRNRRLFVCLLLRPYIDMLFLFLVMCCRWISCFESVFWGPGFCWSWWEDIGCSFLHFVCALLNLSAFVQLMLDFTCEIQCEGCGVGTGCWVRVKWLNCVHDILVHESFRYKYLSSYPLSPSFGSTMYFLTNQGPARLIVEGLKLES